MNDAERVELQRAIAESDIAGSSLAHADIDSLVDLFESWLERRAPADVEAREELQRDAKAAAVSIAGKICAILNTQYPAIDWPFITITNLIEDGFRALPAAVSLSPSYVVNCHKCGAKVELFPATPVAAPESPAVLEPKCTKCGHNNLWDDGQSCKEWLTRTSGANYFCNCCCVFP